MEQLQLPAKKSLGMPIASLILGAVGFSIALFLYLYTVLAFVGGAATATVYGSVDFGPAVIVILVLAIALFLLCLAALILGVAGLVKSILRRTRTVAGIVLSALSVNFAAAGMVLTAVTGILRYLMEHVIM